MKHELKTEELLQLAHLKKLNIEHLKKIKSLLDPKRVRCVLIRNEYKVRSKESALPNREIANLLMKKYDVSRSYIEAIIYETPDRRRQKECVLCGRLTSYYRWRCEPHGHSL